MKNVSMILNVVLIAALFYAGCNPKQVTEDKDNNQTGKTSPTGQTDVCNNFCMDYSNDSSYHFIDGDLLRAMADTFQQTRRTISNSAYTGVDASSAWFALDDLKRFIWEIESKVCKNNCPERLNLGVRIYYAKYPYTGSNAGNSADLKDVPDEFGKMHTVFMIPTYEDKNGNLDFYLDSVANGGNGCRPVAISNNPEDTIGIVTALMAGKNHGTLCPPYCNGAAFGN
jgi:hypothetical protein